MKYEIDIPVDELTDCVEIIVFKNLNGEIQANLSGLRIGKGVKILSILKPMQEDRCPRCQNKLVDGECPFKRTKTKVSPIGYAETLDPTVFDQNEAENERSRQAVSNSGQRIATVRFDGSSGSMSIEQLAKELKSYIK